MRILSHFFEQNVNFLNGNTFFNGCDEMASLPENMSQLSQLIPKPEKDVSCQRLIEMSDVSKHGFLRKMPDSWGGRLFDSVLNRKWSSKYVILRSGCVYVYNSETASNYDRANSLFGFQEVLLCPGDVYKAVKWVFQVVDAIKDQDRDRSMHFSASSESDMKEWIDVFQKEIFNGNMAMLKPKPSVNSRVEKRNVMPRITEEMANEMRRSVVSEETLNICHEENDSSNDSDYSDIDEHEIKIKTMKKVLPNLPVTPSSVLASANKREPNAVRALPKPLLGPKDSKPLRPLPVRPQPQEPTVTPVMPARVTKPTPPPTPDLAPLKQPTFQKLVLPQKPTNQVKPLSSASPVTPKPPPVALKKKPVPQPPGVKVLPQRNANYSEGDYEGGSVYEADEYEVWVPGEEGLNDPLIRASYWTQESEKAQEVMSSIKENGVFLIRDASDGLDYKTLMVCMPEAETSIRKYKIVKESPQSYSLHLGKTGFKSLLELVSYYQKNYLPNRTVTLTKPYSEVWKPR